MEQEVERGGVPAMELSGQRQLTAVHQTLERMGFSRCRATRSYLSLSHHYFWVSVSRNLDEGKMAVEAEAGGSGYS